MGRLEPGKTHYLWLNMMKEGTGDDLRVPVIVAKGIEPGPTFGITSSVHGNEINGIPPIHRLMNELNPQNLCGTVMACPVVNQTGFYNNVREFRDGKDLNRSFPGKPDGNSSQQFCFSVTEKLLSSLNYHVDLHTASFGRVNSFYIRADMQNESVADMAWLCNPQIIVHNCGQPGTLRGAATALGIHSITIEIGNPQVFQHELGAQTFAGIRRILHHLKMYDLGSEVPTPPPNKEDTVLCDGGYWFYTRTGGLLEVHPGELHHHCS